MNRFSIYRFTHPDGRAKEWAYADQGDGTAVIRWGPESQLRAQQQKPLRIAQQRAREKARKGYRLIGVVHLDAEGRPQWPSTPTPDVPRVSKRAPPPSPPTPLERAALLGPGQGFYF